MDHAELERENARLRRLLVTLEKHATVDWEYLCEARATFSVRTPCPWGVKPTVFQILGTLASQDEETP